MFQVKSGRLYSLVNSGLMVLLLASLGACQGRKPEEIKAPERSASRQTAGAAGTTVMSPEQDGLLSAGKTDTAIPVQPKIETGTVPATAPATATPAATPAAGTTSTPTTSTVPGPGNGVTSGTAATPSPWLGNSDRGNNVWKLVPEA